MITKHSERLHFKNVIIVEDTLRLPHGTFPLLKQPAPWGALLSRAGPELPPTRVFSQLSWRLSWVQSVPSSFCRIKPSRCTLLHVIPLIWHCTNSGFSAVAQHLPGKRGS